MYKEILMQLAILQINAKTGRPLILVCTSLKHKYRQKFITNITEAAVSFTQPLQLFGY